jgi:hypothetical protein
MGGLRNKPVRRPLNGLVLPVALSSLWLLTSCGSQVGVSASHTVSAAVSGLQAGKSLVLLNNGANSTPVSANGTFAFSNPISNGGSYSVTVATQPAGETCRASPGSGTVNNVNVTVTVACTANTYTIGGMVGGVFDIGGGVVLQNNHGGTMTISANGAFTFASPVASGATYAVTVLTPPNGESCTVTNGSGTIEGANVTNVSVNCGPLPFRLTVGVLGISNTAGLVLQNNGGDDLPAPGSGVYIFKTLVSKGSPYNVTVSAQPPGHTCFVIGGSGAVTADTTVTVVCPWHVAYMSAPKSNAIYGYYIDEEMGVLVPFESGPFASGNSPGFIAFSAGFAYVLTGDNTVWVYTVDAITGALSPVPTSPVSLGALPYEITINTAGSAAYIPAAANNLPPANTVYGFTVNPSTGAFTPMPGSPFVIGSDPVSVALNPAGTFAYVAATQQIYAYNVDSTTGALTAIAGNPFSAGVASPPTTGSFVVDPTGRFLYEGANSIYAFSIDSATGAPTPITGSPFPIGDNGYQSGMRLDPSGRFLYVLTTELESVNIWHADISTYAIDASTGALTLTSDTPIYQYPGSTMPFGLSIDPSGKYLFATNNASFAIDATTGALSPNFPWPVFYPGVDTSFMAITSLP